MMKYLPVYIIFILTILYFIFVLLSGAGSFRYNGFSEVFLYIIAYPFLEEVVFRGIIQNKLKDYFDGRIFFISYANIIATLIFMFFHFLFSSMDNYFILLIFVPSLILGFLYDYYGRILIPVIVHSLFNINVFIGYNYDLFFKYLNFILK